MTKLSNAKKSAKSVQTVEINTVDIAADKIAATLVNRIALDASDLNANDHSFSGCEIDYSLESTLDSGATVQTENVQPDPMAPYADSMVKLAYSFQAMGMELDIKMVKGNVASETASQFANANDGPKQPVIIRCATSGAEILTVYPSKGVRNVSVVSGTRQTSTRTVSSAGMSEEEKARIEEERKRKEEEKFNRKWLADFEAATKENAKIDAKRERELREMAAKFAKAQEKLRNAPKEGTDNFEQFKLFSEEHGLTCMEGNHAMNVIKNRHDSNYGWKQKGKDFAEQYNKVLIGQFRVCAVAYAKTGKTDKSMKEAMRLVDKSYDENGNVVIPNGWYVIQD